MRKVSVIAITVTYLDMTFATTANITSVVETGDYFVRTVICTIIWASFPMSHVDDMRGDRMDDLISRQAAIDALNGIINRFEQILRDIRESKVDDSVCGMCEYDGAFVGQSGDWCNECPGFEKDDCFRLSDECRKRWLESVELPTAQPEKTLWRGMR